MSGVLQYFRFREKRGSSVSGRREERTTSVSKWERSMRGGSYFPCGGMTEGCSGAAVYGGGRQLELDNVWIDPRWKTTIHARLTERLFESDNVVKIKYAAKMKWVEKERFLGRKKIVKKNLAAAV
jgi:hypothetical protein